ncbi:hypothetical protein BM221_010684 [Beauveria bassiana]|uniref:NmrA-like domain-containing protein n=1 Tax=Beauveria bassiana TaxID=176275 RepID=A0A2N6N872_BEABA|nr:hypothetical protein BM221_010684 [Beauveria bassiana]
MAQPIKNVMVMGAGGLFGTQVFAALSLDTSFTLSILTRKSSKSTFPAQYKVFQVDDDYPLSQLIEAFQGQDALVVEYLKSKENTGLSWTAIHTGQFFDWSLEDGWLDFHLKQQRVVIYDSGSKPWSTTTIGTAAASVVKVLLKPEETKNKPIFVASFTVSQRQVLDELEKATGSKWEVRKMSSAEALKKAADMDNEDYSEGLKLLILMLLYADDVDRGADFEKDGLLCNKMLGLPAENLAEVVGQVVKRQAA